MTNRPETTATAGMQDAPELPSSIGSKIIGLVVVLGAVCSILNFVIQTLHSFS